MIPAPPRLRRDLIVSEQKSADGAVAIVKDPVTDAFYRLGDVERFIVEQCDGETTLDAIRRETERRFDATLPAASLGAFLNRLARAGLLETTAPTPTTGPRGRARGSLLYLRYRIADPDHVFDHLARTLRFCYTPTFLVASALVIVAAVGTAATNWGDITADLSHLYRLATIPPLLAVTFLVASVHEFAHGVTCKRFGGAVHDVGVMLIYLQPACYCNVSDAWLFPEKAKRLWVGIAGPYVELVIWAVAVFLWRLSDVDLWVNYVALLVIASSGVKTLLNLVPLLKLDGYYLLSDYLDVPNLRRRSFAYVGDLLRRGWGGAPRAIAVSRRERRIYVVYGTLAAASSFGLLGIASIRALGILLTRGQPLTLVLFAGLVSTKVRSRVRGLFGKAGGSGDGAQPVIDEWVVAEAPTGDGAQPDEPPPRPRPRPHFLAGRAQPLRGTQPRTGRRRHAGARAGGHRGSGPASGRPDHEGLRHRATHRRGRPAGTRNRCRSRGPGGSPQGASLPRSYVPGGRDRHCDQRGHGCDAERRRGSCLRTEPAGHPRHHGDRQPLAPAEARHERDGEGVRRPPTALGPRAAASGPRARREPLVLVVSFATRIPSFPSKR